MFHLEIFAGLLVGTCMEALQGGPAAAGFLGRIVVTCAALYILFLCGMLGAGDIKLMAMCTGFLGFKDGILVIFLGLGLAALYGGWRLIVHGSLQKKMKRLGSYVIRSGMEGRLFEYPGKRDPESRIRLAPALFAGYCLVLWLS